MNPCIIKCIVILVITVLFIFLTIVLLRLISFAHHPFSVSPKRSRRSPSHLVAVLGSGGHTTEMASLLRDIDPARYVHRTYIASTGDKFAVEKAFQVESRIQAKYRSSGPVDAENWDSVTGIWDLKTVPRARNIHQSLLTTPFSSLRCLIGCVRALNLIAKSSKAAPNEYPDVIIANGPATAAIVILTASMMRFFGVAPSWKMKIIFIESWARVNSLSLSGRILLSLGLCDKFLVQWDKLAKELNKNGEKKVECKGFLVE